jgi:hypothetical protein
MAEELRLGLEGRTILFPDGRPFCLACGRPPTGTRLVAFRDAAYAERASAGADSILGWVHPLLAWANRRRQVMLKFEAPLCFCHRMTGRWSDLVLLTLFLALLGLILVLGWGGLLPGEPGKRGGLLKVALIAVPLAGGAVFHRFRSKRALLPCSAHRESADLVVLVYEDGAPKPRP